MRKLLNKKGQISLGDGPQIVMIVGFIFLIMATIAYVGGKYREAFQAEDVIYTYNETGSLTSSGYALQGMLACNSGGLSIVTVLNSSDGTVLTSTNYTTSGGYIYNASVDEYAIVNITYTNTHSAGAACNVTQDLESELSDNTSIAGIVLTISLVGIVLSILIGIFISSREKGM